MMKKKRPVMIKHTDYSSNGRKVSSKLGRIECPFCHELVADEQYNDHLMSQHPKKYAQKIGRMASPDGEIKPIPDSNSTSDSNEIRAPISSADAKIIPVDESGFILSPMESPQENDHKPGLSKKYDNDVCIICHLSFASIHQHYREIHNLEFHRRRFECLICHQRLSNKDIKGHLCISNNNAAKAKFAPEEVHSPTTRTQTPPSIPSKDQYAQCPTCEECGYRYLHQATHIQKYHLGYARWPNTCCVCGKRLKNVTDTANHLQVNHGVKKIELSVNLIEDPLSDSLMVCTVCKDRLHPDEVKRHRTNCLYTPPNSPTQQSQRKKSPKKTITK